MEMNCLPPGIQFPSYVEELKEVLENVRPPPPSKNHNPRHLSAYIDGYDMDRVYPQLYVGDCDAAGNKRYLKYHGITHVVNAAANKGGPAQVRTSKEFYKGCNIRYLGLDFIDLPFANASRHFFRASKFIYNAIESGGTVLVHCRQGRSRSASITIAYLMIKQGFSAAQALAQLRKSRLVRPNNGFLQQLADLDLQLFRKKMEKWRRKEEGQEYESDSSTTSVSSSSSSEGAEEHEEEENGNESSDEESSESSTDSEYEDAHSELESDSED